MHTFIVIIFLRRKMMRRRCIWQSTKRRMAQRYISSTLFYKTPTSRLQLYEPSYMFHVGEQKIQAKCVFYLQPWLGTNDKRWRDCSTSMFPQQQNRVYEAIVESVPRVVWDRERRWWNCARYSQKYELWSLRRIGKYLFVICFTDVVFHFRGDWIQIIYTKV